MSEALSSGNFESGFLTHPPRWFGRVVSKESWTGNIASSKTNGINDNKGWGYRYKVRIFSWYTGDFSEVADDQLPMASVILPVTSGSGMGGSAMTPSIEPGSLVTGFFMDGFGGQEPWIDGILGNSNNSVPKKQRDGYSIFCDTFKDGTNACKVADFSRYYDVPLSTCDAVQLSVKSSKDQKKDSIKEVPLLDVSKKGNSEIKGVQKTIQNLLNTVQDLKKEFNQASTSLSGDDNFLAKIKKVLNDASKQIAGFMKTKLQGVKSWISTKLDKKVKEIAKSLFPSEMPKLYQEVKKGLDLLSCVFGKIVGGLKSLISGILGKVLDKFVTAPSCSAQNVMSDILNNILGTITGALSTVLTPINALFGGVASISSLALGALTSSALGIIDSVGAIGEQVSGVVGQLGGIAGSIGDIGGQIEGLTTQFGAALGKLQGLSLPNIGNLLNALDFVPGILKFFSCDEEQKSPSYNTITQDGPAKPSGGGADLFGNISNVISSVSNIQSSIGGVIGNVTGIVGQVQGLIALGQSIPDQLLGQVTDVLGQFSGIMGQFTDLADSISGSGGNCDTGPVVCGPPTVVIFGGGGLGAAANAIISPVSSSVIAFDILNSGSGYTSIPTVILEDPCGKGNGACLDAVIEDGKLVKIVICSTGDGYLPAPDGSLGGGGQTWKEPDEGYVKCPEGNTFIVQKERPINVDAGCTYYPPNAQPIVLEEPQTINLTPTIVNPPKAETTPVLLCLDTIEVADGGFGYKPGDNIIITPDNGIVAEPVINDRGEIEKINIVSGGCGFIDLPEIRTDSETGFNAEFLPVLKVTPVKDVTTLAPNIQVVNVVDCVGKTPVKKDFYIVPK